MKFADPQTDLREILSATREEIEIVRRRGPQQCTLQLIHGRLPSELAAQTITQPMPPAHQPAGRAFNGGR